MTYVVFSHDPSRRPLSLIAHPTSSFYSELGSAEKIENFRGAFGILVKRLRTKVPDVSFSVVIPGHSVWIKILRNINTPDMTSNSVALVVSVE